MPTKGDKQIFELLRDTPAKKVYRYSDELYLGEYWVKEVTYRGVTIFQELLAANPQITTDYCENCGWLGPSVEVARNRCPVCGSKELQDKTDI
jgi:hypothetical protein